MLKAAYLISFRGLPSLLRSDLSPETIRILLLALAWSIPLLGVLWTLYHAPAWLEPRQLRIDLAPGQSVILGHQREQHRDDLWSPHADSEHIRILRTTTGDWRLENVAASKQVLWKPLGAKDDRRVREWQLPSGGRFTVGDHPFVVTAATPDGLTLQSESQTWRYDGVSLFQNGQALPHCDPSRLATFWNALRARLHWTRPFSLGGGVQCATRLGLTGVAADSVLITSIAGGYVLHLGPAARPDGPLVSVESAADGQTPLRELTVPLTVGDRLIIGYTKYQVTRTAGFLTLAVTARGQRWPADQPRPDSSPAVQVELKPFALHGPHWTVLLALALPWLGIFWLRGHYFLNQPEWPARLGLLLCLSLACGALALYPWPWNDAATILWSYALAWLAFAGWSSWAATRRTVWSALLVGLLTWLTGWELITQLQLGIGADESVWLYYGASTAALLGLLGWSLLAGLIFWRKFHPHWSLNDRLADIGVITLAGVSLFLLGLQVLVGNEAGLKIFQPFELTKLALIVSAAAALTQRMGLHNWDWTLSKLMLWIRYLGPVFILAVLVVFALFFLHDFSPLLLLLISALSLAWSYFRILPDQYQYWRLGGQGLVLMAVIGLALGVIQLRQHPAWFPKNMKSERIQVWVAPERYPHTGYQLRQALTAIRVGGWWGTNTSALPGNAKPGWNGRVMTLPEVQNDFAPAFFLNRYGGVASLTLLAAQILLLLTLLRIGERGSKMATREGSYRLQALGGFAYFTLFGGCGLLAAHMLVSWGTNLGFLPVMGQPMPLLSAAGSHLILLVGPIIALALALEEGCLDEH